MVLATSAPLGGAKARWRLWFLVAATCRLGARLGGAPSGLARFNRRLTQGSAVAEPWAGE
jgi:hypothetical protein